MGNIKRVLIDRNTLVGKDGLFSKRGCPGNCQHCSLWTEDGCRVILEAPTVEIVHGQWIVEEDGNFRNVKCSVCGKEYACHYGMLQLQNFDYCPNCGARMDL